MSQPSDFGGRAASVVALDLKRDCIHALERKRTERSLRVILLYSHEHLLEISHFYLRNTLQDPDICRIVHRGQAMIVKL